MSAIEQMIFLELKEEFGFGFAVRVYEHKLDPEFFENLDLDQWGEIAMITINETDLNKRALEIITAVKKSFRFWIRIKRKINVGFWSFENAEFTEFIRKRMFETAHRFWQWLQVFQYYNNFSVSEKNEILKQLFKHARNNTKNLRQMYKMSKRALPEGLGSDSVMDEFRDQVMEKMIDIAQTYDDWFFIIDNCSDGYRYVDNILPLVKTPAQWWKAWLRFLYCFDEFREKVFNKLEELCHSFDDWYSFYCKYARFFEYLEYEIVKCIMNKANSQMQWWITYKIICQFHDFDTYLEVVRKLLEYDLTITHYREMWEHAVDWDDQEMIIAAIQKRI